MVKHTTNSIKSSLSFCMINSVILFLICFNLFSQHLTEINKKDAKNTVVLKSGSNIVSTYPIYSNENLTSGIPAQTINEDLTTSGWELKFSATGRPFKDISFANTQVGYIVTEQGAVYKSTDSGDNWSSVLDLGSPYYWYGVQALSPDTVIISGFNTQAAVTSGIIRWTFNGGASWSQDIVLNKTSGLGWLDRVHFFNTNIGIVMNSLSGGCWYTSNGGYEVSSWTYIQINSDNAWFAGNIDAQASGNIYATGVHIAQSTNFGINWTSGACADVVFDGGIDFLDFNNLFGWTGGGQISAPLSGWVCRTTNGGTNWSTRLNTFSYPIREVHFLNENFGWSIGGNNFDNTGGIYSTTDGGLSWNLEVNTSAEMFSLIYKQISADSMDVWCVGTTGSTTGYTGKLYKKRIHNIITGINNGPATAFQLEQSFPNPCNSVITIEFTIPENCHVTLKIFDHLGKEIATLINQNEVAGKKSVQFDASMLPCGTYYYQLQSGNYSETRRFVKVR